MLRIVLVLILLLPASLGGQARTRTPQVEAVLVPQTRSIQPGEPVRMAIRLSVAPGWHIYWTNPGESGLPTTVRWRGPTGFQVGPTRWPYPERQGLASLVTHTYEGEVVLLTDLHPSADLRGGGRAELVAQVGWGVCRDVCIPQEVRLSVDLPVRDRTPRPNPRWHAVAAEAAPRLPQSLAGWTLGARVEGEEIRLHIVPPAGNPGSGEPLTFFPDDPDVLLAAVSAVPERDGDGWILRLPGMEPGPEPPARLRGVLVGHAGWGFRALRVDVPVKTPG